MVTAGVGHPLEQPVEQRAMIQSTVSWSPDSQWIAFDDDGVTLVVSRTTADLIPLGAGGQPHWRPT